ncbi:hypothetical protein Glove_21g64 [Diversispora epigaea]|uniref:Protein kinase domain-containing protein n=1 Tax=Diversispora epigaea TaxID=1348612 RepID=A0A397JP82_9GLOM|nr:hypothetical protein Glove_21g64 [Diversispora epigaea]
MMVLCGECNHEYTYYNWCKPCHSKHFKNDFDKWTSGNETIDKLIQNAQLNANDCWKVIEWIPYNRFKDIREIAKGGFGTIYYAKWIDGRIEKWDIENQRWKRWGQREVVLKKVDNFANLNEEFLNEMTIHLKTMDIVNSSIRIYGITKDPETNKYIMILEYMRAGNLRDYLKNHFNNINWNCKLCHLSDLASSFNKFHTLDILHGDFHSGNILSFNFKFNSLYTSDFGLKVLCGEEYTKAADVYSFGIVVYEFITGFAPYYDVPHDRDLARQICNGLRPKIPFHTPKLITRIIMRCWDARVTHRPTFEELHKELNKCHDDYRENYFKNNNEITIQIDNAVKLFKNKSKRGLWRLIRDKSTTPLNYQIHPEAFFSSRLLHYSNLPEPKNEEIFEKKLEEITKSVSAFSVVVSKPINMHVP